jgi:hypothetical protein
MADSDVHDGRSDSRLTGSRPAPRLARFVRGLVAGAIGIAITAMLTFGALRLMRPPGGSCGSDLVCLPDVTGILLTGAAIPVVLSLLGPLAARLLRLPEPWLYAIPAAWAVVVVCLGLGLGGQTVATPGAAVGFLALWISYGVIAVWRSGRPTGDREESRW